MPLFYRLTGPARQDLDEIWDYLYREILSLNVPNRVLDNIHHHLDAIADNPSIGHRRDDQTDRDVWFSRIYSYLVIYSMGTDHVAILGLVHMARDLPEVLHDRD
ncbi:MAG: type II toxin-antitoxin system RelE/ParE family toxin [Chlorobia bacterium]|nr:type II toxin-antitoxin system RelE/ParE family toxin [Fimbriimonadaceae bacterium]